MVNFLIALALAFAIIAVLKGYINKKKANSLVEDTDTLDERYNAKKRSKELKIDDILDKVSKKGMHSLSSEERTFLDKHAKD